MVRIRQKHPENYRCEIQLIDLFISLSGCEYVRCNLYLCYDCTGLWCLKGMLVDYFNVVHIKLPGATVATGSTGIGIG